MKHSLTQSIGPPKMEAEGLSANTSQTIFSFRLAAAHMRLVQCAQPLCNPKVVNLPRMQISELATRSGVSTHAIRHWERLGLIAARRRPSGYREFDESVIRELRFVVMSKQCGFTLPQIAEVLPAYRSKALTAARMIAMLEDRIAEIDVEIAKQQALREHLVSHIEWFREREQRASKKKGFPRSPARRGTGNGMAGKKEKTT